MLGYLNEVWSWRNFRSNFDVSLTVHLSITLANDQLDAQIFNTFIIILYMYMFRAISYDMIYLLTAIGLSPGSSAHLHTNNT